MSGKFSINKLFNPKLKDKKDTKDNAGNMSIIDNPTFQEFDKELSYPHSGKHFLNDSSLAKITADSIHFWDQKRIDLYCYCIMSNHVHAVFQVFEKDESGSPLYLQDIMKSIKNFSAKKINEATRRKGQFWYHESYDRLVRDREELFWTISYVLDNPIKAGLCNERKDWIWSYINPQYDEFM